MNQNQTLQRFLILQQELGGVFKKQHLNPRIYRSVLYAVDRQNNPQHITRLMLLGDKHVILKHYHKKVIEHLTFVHIPPDSYGHLHLPQGRPIAIEKNFEKQFVFEPFEAHGIVVSKGCMIVQIEIHGDFSTEDVHPHI